MNIFTRQIAFILFFFLVTQFLGLYVGASMSANKAEFEPFDVAISGQENVFNPVFFIFAVVCGAVFFFVMLKFYKGVLLFKLLESFIIFVSSNIVFYVTLLSWGVPFYYVFSFLAAIALTALKFFNPRLKNLAAIIASAGVAAVFGFSLDLLSAIVFIVGLSIYDVLAVFFTRHMVVMAKELSKRQLAFSVTAEQKVQVKLPQKKKPVEQKSVLELGTGDLSIPAMLSVSAFNYGAAASFSSGLALALFSILGSSIALFCVLHFVLKNRLFLPALPPLAFGGLVGIAFAKLLGF